MIYYTSSKMGLGIIAMLTIQIMIKNKTVKEKVPT